MLSNKHLPNFSFMLHIHHGLSGGCAQATQSGSPLTDEHTAEGKESLKGLAQVSNALAWTGHRIFLLKTLWPELITWFHLRLGSQYYHVLRGGEPEIFGRQY